MWSSVLRFVLATFRVVFCGLVIFKFGSNTRMRTQTVSPLERFAAIVAFERRLSSMNTHVLPERTGVAEPHWTQQTRIRLHAGVYHFVPQSVMSLRESLRTEAAVETFLFTIVDTRKEVTFVDSARNDVGCDSIHQQVFVDVSNT